jgi:hypothetical protein
MVRSKQVDPRIAAFRDLETRTANAWKPKFQQQLALAVSYLPTTKPQTQEDRAAIEDLIKSLKKKYLRGRPRGKATSRLPRVPNNPPRAEKVAAVVVQVEQARLSWLIKNPDRRRVPPAVTKKQIADAIKGSDISADEIRRALKLK